MPPRNRISLEQREMIVHAFEDVHEDYLAIAETIGWSKQIDCKRYTCSFTLRPRRKDS